MLNKLPPGVCWGGGGGGGGGATGLLNKGGGSNRLPVEFPQVQTSDHNLVYSHCKNIFIHIRTFQYIFLH